MMTIEAGAAAAVTARPPRLGSAAHWHVAPVWGVVHPHQVQVPPQVRFRFLYLERCSSKGLGQVSRVRGTHMGARRRRTRITILRVSSNRSSSHNDNSDKYVGNSRRSRSRSRNYHRLTSAIQRHLCPRTAGILLACNHSTFPLRRREDHHGSAVLTVERGGRARGSASPLRCPYRLRLGFYPESQKRLGKMTRVWRISIRGLMRIVVIDLVS